LLEAAVLIYLNGLGFSVPPARAAHGPQR
jgi:hypothetical protein